MHSVSSTHSVSVWSAAFLLLGCQRAVHLANQAPVRAYTVRDVANIETLAWPQLHLHADILRARASTRFSMRSCELTSSPGTVLAPTAIDDFSIVLGVGSLTIVCAAPNDGVRLRVVTCSGALDVRNGRAVVAFDNLSTQVQVSQNTAFFWQSNESPLNLSAGLLQTIGVRGELTILAPGTTAVVVAPSLERSRSEFETVVVALDASLVSLHEAFQRAQELTVQHAQATRNGARQDAQRSAQGLAASSTQQHVARERVRLLYSRLLACDLTREAKHLAIPPLSAAYAARLRAELGIHRLSGE